MFSPAIEELIDRLRFLPGVGPKTAQRMAFHLLEKNRAHGLQLGQALFDAMEKVGHCKQCNTLCETERCRICEAPDRDTTRLCVVENPTDVISIEQTGRHRGYYFVLMGHLSPMDGVGPDDIGINLLLARIRVASPKELILATNSTMEGEATAHYIYTQVQALNILCTRIAHGVPIGSELEYLDGRTITQAFVTRQRLDQAPQEIND